MPNALRWRNKIVLAKIETTYGTDPVPAAANGMLMTDVEVRPMEGEDVSRDLERPYFGAQAEIPAALRAVLTGSTELVGSGTAGTAPSWGPLARMCGLAQVVNAGVSVVYTPITDAMESGTVYFWGDTTLQKLIGARGSGVLGLSAQGIPTIKWTLTGLWAAPTETARVNPTLSGFQAPVLSNKANTPTFTVNSVAMVLRKFEMNLGCKVEPRLLVGREEIMIVDRSEEIMAQVEAVPVTTLNPFTLAQNQTQVPVSLVHGTTAGKIVTVSAPLAQVKRMPGYEVNQNLIEWPLRLTPIPNAGNDQFSITLT